MYSISIYAYTYILLSPYKNFVPWCLSGQIIIREISESSGAVSGCLLPRVFREICGKLFFVSSRLGGYISLCSLWPLWPIFNQKRSTIKPKIEKSKKFLSPFLTSIYENLESRIQNRESSISLRRTQLAIHASRDTKYDFNPSHPPLSNNHLP